MPSASECQKGRGRVPGRVAGGGAQAHIVGGCFAKRSGCVAYKAFASVTSGYMGGGNRVQAVQTVQNVQIAHIMPHEQRN